MIVYASVCCRRLGKAHKFPFIAIKSPQNIPSVEKLPLFAVILERTDGNIGSDRISSQNSTNFQKNPIFCYGILSGKALPSRMTVRSVRLYADENFSNGQSRTPVPTIA